MTRKQKRFAVIAGGLAILGLAVGLIAYALSSKITFFYTPSDIAEKGIETGRSIRLGGMVEAGSWKKGEGTQHHFVVTDTLKTLEVTFNGVLPDLFREGQGVVAEGVLLPDGTFAADTVLAKHDENYMPRELSDSLKARGVKLGKGADE